MFSSPFFLGFIDSDIPVCATCGEEKVSKKCSQCKSVQYCDRDCQKYHWFVHKKYCKKVTTSESHTTEKEKSKEDGSKEITAALKSEMANLKVS